MAEELYKFAVPLRNSTTGLRRWWNGSSWEEDPDGGVYGEHVMGIAAMFYNTIQCLTGAAIVDYNSIDNNLTTTRDGQLLYLDTSWVDPTGLTGSGDSRYALGLDQKTNYPTGSNDYQVIMLAGGTTFIVVDVTAGGGTLLYSNTAGSTTFQTGSVQEATTNGDTSEVHFYIHIDAGGVSPWQSADQFTFTVKENTGDTSRNWSEPFMLTNRATPHASFGANPPVTTLYRDTGRGTDAQPDYVAIRMDPGFTSMQMSTTEFTNIDNLSSDSGFLYDGNGGYASALFVGEYKNASADEMPNLFHLYRSNQYFRCMYTMESESTPLEPDLTQAQWDKTNVFFMGNINTYMTYSQWERPVAVLAQDNHGTDGNRRFPFFKTATATAHQPRGTGYVVAMPYILGIPQDEVAPRITQAGSTTAVPPDHINGDTPAVAFDYDTKFIAFEGFEARGIADNWIASHNGENCEIGMLRNQRAASRNSPAMIVPLQMTAKQSLELNGAIPTQISLLDNPAAVHHGVLGELPGLYYTPAKRDSDGLAASWWSEESTHQISSLDEQGLAVSYYIVEGASRDVGTAPVDTNQRTGVLLFRIEPY